MTHTSNTQGRQAGNTRQYIRSYGGFTWWTQTIVHIFSEEQIFLNTFSNYNLK
jgi:hypothetical protein